MINRLIRNSVCLTTQRTLWVFVLGFAASTLLMTAPLTVDASVPPMISQFIGVEDTIVNEEGESLVGTDPYAHEFGIPVVEGAVVQILSANDGTIYPPDLNGNPDSRNAVLLTTRIGIGMSPALARTGKFAAMLAPRPSGGVKIFVRVFNAASLDDASFYGDSEVFTVSSMENESFIANVEKTDKPLDAADPDQDGLNNSQEKSLGSNPFASDSDGDEYNDAQELIAGTDSLNEDSFPSITSISPEGPGLTRVSWSPAVSGRTYKIYFKANLIEGEEGTVLGTIVASSAVDNSVVLTNSSLPGNGSFVFKVSK